MPNEPVPTQGVMEGKGAYNRYAKLPAGGAALALPLLEKAVPCVTLPADQGIVMADYGSSQGKNSMVPIQIAIRTLRGRVGGSRPISVSTLTNHPTISTRCLRFLRGKVARPLISGNPDSVDQAPNFLGSIPLFSFSFRCSPNAISTVFRLSAGSSSFSRLEIMTPGSSAGRVNLWPFLPIHESNRWNDIGGVLRYTLEPHSYRDEGEHFVHCQTAVPVHAASRETCSLFLLL